VNANCRKLETQSYSSSSSTLELPLVSEEIHANVQSLYLRKRRPRLFAARHPRLGHADLGSRRGNRDAKYASSLLGFGASPYQVFEDDDEYD
jgi:hypothetical protein